MISFLFLFFVSGKPLEHFSAVGETAVSALFNKMGWKTCDLDSMPAFLLFDCSGEIVPALTHAENESLLTGTILTVCKLAIVKRLLEKKKKLRLTQNI